MMEIEIIILDFHERNIYAVKKGRDIKTIILVFIFLLALLHCINIMFPNSPFLLVVRISIAF